VFVVLLIAFVIAAVAVLLLRLVLHSGRPSILRCRRPFLVCVAHQLCLLQNFICKNQWL
jgi:hypothetical protein